MGLDVGAGVGGIEGREGGDEFHGLDADGDDLADEADDVRSQSAMTGSV